MVVGWLVNPRRPRVMVVGWLVNPRRPRVMVVGWFVCLSVCLFEISESAYLAATALCLQHG